MASELVIIDTDIAILLRDSDPDAISRVRGLGQPVAISIVTRIELEGGASPPNPRHAERRARLERLLQAVDVLAFETADADAYAGIVSKTGWSRRKVLDRMIAAQALARDVALATLNAADFHDVPGLKLLAR